MRFYVQLSLEVMATALAISGDNVESWRKFFLTAVPLV